MHEQSKENFYVDALQETCKTSCKNVLNEREQKTVMANLY